MRFGHLDSIRRSLATARALPVIAILALLGGGSSCRTNNPADEIPPPPTPPPTTKATATPESAETEETAETAMISALGGKLRVPKGFRVEVFSKEVPNARGMALGPEGTLFVGSRQAGKVYAVVDEDGDGRGDRVHTIAEGLQMPVGLDVRDGALYVSATDRVLRFDGIETKLDSPPTPAVVSEAFPDDTHHGWKFIRFGPDGWLYVPVGAPCNMCLEEDERYASIMRMKPDGSALEVYAHGVRNTVGFDWHPESGAMYFTDNGRDMLGDDLPPDELNRASEKGQHFGYPFCHAGTIADPEFGEQRPCREFVPPVQKLGPHVAALGMRFYTGTQFPAEYRGAIFLAEHGSWNRSEPIGYRVSVVKLDGEGNATSYEPFVEGWLREGEAWGRPVDVLVMPDGALLISDDRAGWIYRVSYEAG
nr:sorbosone dehydrogenase family protein [Haliangium ochraceum]